MKRALAVVLAAAFVGLLAGGAMAQVPYYQIYFDQNWTQTSYPSCQPANTPMDIYLVALNLNTFVSGADFQVDLSGAPGLMYLGDSPYFPHAPNDLSIGNANDGEAIAWNLPLNGYNPVPLTTIHVLWTGNCNCSAPSSIVVRPYPGQINPSYVAWPAYEQLFAVGMTSLICPGTVATKSTTWGGVKALYR